MIDWHTMNEKPRKGSRIIAFSPKHNNPSLRFRLMDESFLRICDDSQLWAYIDDPETDYVD